MLLRQSAVIASMLAIGVVASLAAAQYSDEGDWYETEPVGLYPAYRAGDNCSPLTSLFASWIDVDGSRRDERHSGVDGGRLGEKILAPAAGEVHAVWRSNWGWGWEGSLIIRHTREDLGLDEGPALYYSVFDHLSYEEIKDLQVGQRVKRGQSIGHVHRPGGSPRYLAEVHWEVWEADADRIEWGVNRYGGRTWSNTSARLVDPLMLLQLASGLSPWSRKVGIVPAQECASGSECVGFTYILPCSPKDGYDNR